jgi:hypothetical protein
MRLLRPLHAVAFALAVLLPAFAGANEVCDPGQSRGAVSLMILKSDAQVHVLAKSLARGVPMAARDAATVVFQDGRVITSDVESAGRVLNALGWGARRIDVVASFGNRRARPARARG